MWSEETAELFKLIDGVEWLLSRGKGATPAQIEEWEGWLEVMYEDLEEQPDWIAWKKSEFGADEG